MSRESKEYSVRELLDHPVVGQAMKTEGIDRRSLELMLDTAGRDPRRTRDRADPPFARKDR
jgi:hypothetical protein